VEPNNKAGPKAIMKWSRFIRPGLVFQHTFGISTAVFDVIIDGQESIQVAEYTKPDWNRIAEEALYNFNIHGLAHGRSSLRRGGVRAVTIRCSADYR